MDNSLPKSFAAVGAGQDWALLYDKAAWDKTNVESGFKSLKNPGAPLSKGVVGAGAGQPWMLLYDGVPTLQESGFESLKNPGAVLSKGVVGAGMNQHWALMYDGVPNLQESPFLAAGLAALSLHRRVFCSKYVKSLGYLRREKIGGDKVSYIQAINECLVNFKKIKKGSYKIKPADLQGSKTDINALLDQTSSETGVPANDPNLDNLPAPTAKEVQDTTAIAAPATASPMKWILIAVAIVIVIVAIVIFMRKRAAKA